MLRRVLRSRSSAALLALAGTSVASASCALAARDGGPVSHVLPSVRPRMAQALPARRTMTTTWPMSAATAVVDCSAAAPKRAAHDTAQHGKPWACTRVSTLLAVSPGTGGDQLSGRDAGDSGAGDSGARASPGAAAGRPANILSLFRSRDDDVSAAQANTQVVDAPTTPINHYLIWGAIGLAFGTAVGLIILRVSRVRRRGPRRLDAYILASRVPACRSVGKYGSKAGKTNRDILYVRPSVPVSGTRVL